MIKYFHGHNRYFPDYSRVTFVETYFYNVSLTIINFSHNFISIGKINNLFSSPKNKLDLLSSSGIYSIPIHVVKKCIDISGGISLCRTPEKIGHQIVFDNTPIGAKECQFSNRKNIVNFKWDTSTCKAGLSYQTISYARRERFSVA